MKISFLIVTKARPQELEFTLKKIQKLIDRTIHEVRVFIDGCPLTENLVEKYPWVNWQVSKKSIGASPARSVLYKEAKGEIFIGLDDDAHPVSLNFIEAVEEEYFKNPNLGIIAFQEVRGIFENDNSALAEANIERESHLTKDFVGCGFAVSRKAYFSSRGFPTWMDIYGEESCVAIEILDHDFDILYQPKNIVNHRVDVEKRKKAGRNYFRFQKQLQNTLKYSLVYYPNPSYRILKVLHHNFKKYALQDFRFFKLYFKSIFNVLISLHTTLHFRKKVSRATIDKMKKLKGLQY